MSTFSYGESAYLGYCQEDSMPRFRWDDLSTEEKVRWEAAAQSVLRKLLAENETPVSLHHHD